MTTVDLAGSYLGVIGPEKAPEVVFVFFQAEDGIRDADVTGVQTCALPICHHGPCRGEVASRGAQGRAARGARAVEVRSLVEAVLDEARACCVHGDRRSRGRGLRRPSPSGSMSSRRKSSTVRGGSGSPGPGCAVPGVTQPRPSGLHPRAARARLRRLRSTRESAPDGPRIHRTSRQPARNAPKCPTLWTRRSRPRPGTGHTRLEATPFPGGARPCQWLELVFEHDRTRSIDPLV